MALKETFEKQGNWLFRNRSYLPLLIIFPGVLWYLYLLIEAKIESNPWWLDFIYLLIGFVGLGIRIFTVGFTPKGTSGRNTKQGQIAEELNKTEIYSIVRHPLYLGNFFMWLAPVLVIGDFWFIMFFCTVYWLYYERIMFAEEEFLRRKFGAEFEEWASKTPAFIPKISLFVRNKLNFSAKNVLRREYNGFYNLIFIMTLLRSIGIYISTGELYLDIPWSIVFSQERLYF